jgi:hypothetical protein
VDALPPWVFQARFREEVKVDEGHHVFHKLIRFKGVEQSKPSQPAPKREVVATEEFVREEMKRMEERLSKTMAEMIDRKFSNIEKLLAARSGPTAPTINGITKHT